MGTAFRLVREYYIDNSELVFVYENFEKYHMPWIEVIPNFSKTENISTTKKCSNELFQKLKTIL